MSATISGIGHALPPAKSQEAVWEEFFAEHYAGNELAEKIWRRSGVKTRCAVFDPARHDVSQWSTGERMSRFVEAALPLGKRALERAMADAGLVAHEVEQLTVVSCTGYATPGLDILLARDLGLSPHVQRLHVGHMGCYAAVPALATVADAAAARAKTGLMLCLEISSLHLQPPTDDIEQVVAHALFADAAAAIAVRARAPAGGGLRVLDFVAKTDVENSHMMRWDITDLGFRMGLSPMVPTVLERHTHSVLDELLAPHGLTVPDIHSWAIHPGGPRIVDVVVEQLDLEDHHVDDSREVLRSVGNCSSATVLLVLQRIMQGEQLPPGGHCVMLAFGPGLTLYAALLRRDT